MNGTKTPSHRMRPEGRRQLWPRERGSTIADVERDQLHEDNDIDLVEDDWGYRRAALS